MHNAYIYIILYIILYVMVCVSLMFFCTFFNFGIRLSLKGSRSNFDCLRIFPLLSPPLPYSFSFLPIAKYNSFKLYQKIPFRGVNLVR